MQKPILTVSEVNRYIKDVLSNNIILSSCLVRGEISNFKYHYSGHMYFTLKDEHSTMRCVMFKGSCDGLKFGPQDGMKVIVAGRISVYERDGNYQLYADDMQPDGVGALHLAFEQLKKRLEGEGLFNELFKKPIPLLPNSIGIITSPTGAAVRDILNILTRRFFNIKIVVYPVLVQGEGAKEQIAKAIDDFNVLKNVDVIIVTRGGGSIEELWAFNEEIVARSIANSKIPIISAVGHETDYTISDFVSDLRAPTPSAAAELVVPNRIDVEAIISNYYNRLNYAIESIFKRKRLILERMMNSNVFREPKDSIYQYRIRLDIINKSMRKDIGHLLKNRELVLREYIGKLCSLNPLEVLKRGYSIASSIEGVYSSVKDIHIGDELKVQFTDGQIRCKVFDKQEDK